MDKKYVWLIVVVSAAFLVLSYKIQALSLTVSDVKMERCVFAMQKAIPDANDTEGRALFLKNCY